ncbi:hypothetical protein KUCAC02_007769 [Chaenocephalus aceratus]|uniref:Uncharacterized protein n=1 Tax=Chaenocephalus aceratus TaxID=36190 RepID=A0ACB9X787_CHAAC|nr:hypothetical protein KUCAC02_007769 [Chaenocephalus aceratus]
MTATDPITQNVSTDGGMIDKTSTSPATSHMSLTESSNPSSSHSTSSFVTLPPSTTEHSTASVATVTIEKATAESTTMEPDSTHAETTFSQYFTESSTSTAAVSSTINENSYFTTGSPTDSPSAPTSSTTLSTTSPETSQPTNTNSCDDHLTLTLPFHHKPKPNSRTPTLFTYLHHHLQFSPYLPKHFLVNGRCAQAQVFSGKLHLTSLTFKNEMSNRSSVIFRETAFQISTTLRNALKNQPGYKQSDVVQLKPGSVQAIAIQEAIANPENTLLADATFIGTNLCVQEPLPCDVSTTMCTNTNGRPLCSCREGYISILYSNSSCKACPSGQREVGDTCQPCAFGYAGFNCNDSALLAVVVISCVLGGVLIILLLTLLIYCFRMRSSKSKPDLSRKMTDGGSAHVKKHQTNGLGFHPKQKGWKKSGSYDLNPDGMNTFTGKNPSRYSYLVQGHENPYFLPGEDSKN